MRKTLILTPLLIVFLAVPRIAAAAEVCPTFGGRATVVQANVLGIPTVLADTGNIDSTGGEKQASLLTSAVAGLLTADDLHATVVAGGSKSRAEASVSNLSLTVAGNTIGADFVMARATASCASPGATVLGVVEIDGLTVNGQSVPVTGFPNQVVSLLGGAFMILNEQTSSVGGPTASITVNALHVSALGVDIVIGADPVINVGATPFIVINNNPPPGPGCDFVTGGGWITAPSMSKGTFGVAGGVNSDLNGWGHLEYHDHGTPSLNVHGTQVLYYATPFPIADPNLREIGGTANVNGQSGSFYIVDVRDSGESGTNDFFEIRLFNSQTDFENQTNPAYTALGTLQGGNIQLHNKCF